MTVVVVTGAASGMRRDCVERLRTLGDVLLGRLGAANEVADVVAYLVSDAASFVSGIDVLVDGAMIQGMNASAT